MIGSSVVRPPRSAARADVRTIVTSRRREELGNPRPEIAHQLEESRREQRRTKARLANKAKSRP
jgi:hypothetical protein